LTEAAPIATNRSADLFTVFFSRLCETLPYEPATKCLEFEHVLYNVSYTPTTAVRFFTARLALHSVVGMFSRQALSRLLSVAQETTEPPSKQSLVVA